MDFSGLWNKDKCLVFCDYLKSLSDIKYKEFNSKIINNTKYEMLGIRLPVLRKIAKEIKKADYLSFLDNFKGKYYEEILLYGLVLGLVSDIDIFMKYFYSYLDLIDNR